MATQILALVALTLGTGADAVTHPAGWIGHVDDAVADDLIKMDPPAAKLDTSPLAASAAPKRNRSARQSAPVVDPIGGGDGGGEVGAPDGAAGGGAAGGGAAGGGAAGGGEAGGGEG